MGAEVKGTGLTLMLLLSGGLNIITYPIEPYHTQTNNTHIGWEKKGVGTGKPIPLAPLPYPPPATKNY